MGKVSDIVREKPLLVTLRRELFPRLLPKDPLVRLPERTLPVVAEHFVGPLYAWANSAV